MKIRLQRYLAQAGVASRRKSEDLIAAGLVAVNGRVVTRPGTTVDAGADSVTLRGSPIRPRHVEDSTDQPIGIAFHKPPGVLTSSQDPGGGRTVYDFVEAPRGSRLIYVGRLDRDTEGLLLFTTNGRLVHRLTHPRWQVERVYQADVSGRLDEARLAATGRRGILLEDGRTGPFLVRHLERRKGMARIELILKEGRNREVRRIIAACGGRVERLVRTRYGSVGLGGLEAGEYRRLEPREMQGLLVLVGLASGGRKGSATWR